jgi:hypothetical protein
MPYSACRDSPAAAVIPNTSTSTLACCILTSLFSGKTRDPRLYPKPKAPNSHQIVLPQDLQVLLEVFRDEILNPGLLQRFWPDAQLERVCRVRLQIARGHTQFVSRTARQTALLAGCPT